MTTTTEPRFDPSAAALPGSGIFGLPHGASDAAVHVIGVPFDATASYRKGAWRAPAAILRASRQVDLFDLAHGRAYERGIWMAPVNERVLALNREASGLADRVIERGGAIEGDAELARDLARVNSIGGEVNLIVRAAAGAALDAGKLVAVVGGDHSAPFGAIQACAERFPGLGVLHFDAHADLRVAYEGFEWSHASIMDNVERRLGGVARIVQVAIRDLSEEEHERVASSGGRIATLFDRERANAAFDGRNPRHVARAYLAKLPRDVYVSFDVDGLDPALCPSTGTPVPGGLGWNEALLWLDELAASGRRVVGLDLSEVNPGAAGEDGDSWDAIVGARLLYQMIGAALRTRG
jgi:agmatinase